MTEGEHIAMTTNLQVEIKYSHPPYFNFLAVNIRILLS